jgi:hypothetical protein
LPPEEKQPGSLSIVASDVAIEFRPAEDLVTAKGEESIPIFGDFGLAHQIGTAEYARPRRFREKLGDWLRIIRLVWPDCPAKIRSDGRYLMINHATAVRSSAECQSGNPLFTWDASLDATSVTKD